MSGTAIAWIDAPAPHGRWGHPEELCLPLNDRGLLLADGLFETVLVDAGQPRLLEAHLERWRRSAQLLAMAPPPAEASVRPLLEQAVIRSGIDEGALRLNWSRGGGGRGLDEPGPGEACWSHRFWLQLSPCRASFEPLRVIVSRLEQRNAASLLSRCKTFAYGSSILARREARAAGADDALLLSTAGGLCCGTSANLLVRWAGTWLTPPLTSGCLPGVMRARAIERDLVREAPLEPATLLAAEGAVLINSLGCRAIRSCDGLELPLNMEGLSLWRRVVA
jgi:branched-subunit amino acid aminotransferase/4-amino-4-deoxychorismate lyase